MSIKSATNMIIKKKNQLRKYKECCISSIDITNVLEWLDSIQLELTD